MGIYYPSLVCSLTLRIDEALLSGKVPTSLSAQQISGQAFSLPMGATGKVGIIEGADGDLSHLLYIVPKQASVELPGYRQARKFSLTFSYRDFPLDPRAMRAVGVEIYIGTVTDINFARGMFLEKDYGRLASVLPINDKNLILSGTADSITTTFSEKGSEVQIEGRGIEGIFHDSKLVADSIKKVKVDQPIDAVVRDLLSEIGFGKAGVTVEADKSDWPNGIVPSPGSRAVLTRTNLGKMGQSPKLPAKGDSASSSVWDLITNACFYVGAVPFFEGRILKIRAAKNLFQQKAAGVTGNATPFKDGKKRTIEVNKEKSDISVRKMVYGRNLREFKLERKFGGVKVPTIICRSTNTDSKERGDKKIIEAKWPDIMLGVDPAKVENSKKTSIAPNGKSAQEEVIVITVHGIKDKDRLQEIAKNIREEIGRGEMGGSASTRDLASFGGDNTDTDLLTLRPGDAVEFEVDATGLSGRPPVISDLTLENQKPAAELAKAISAKLGPGYEKLAELLAKTKNGTVVGLQSAFRVSNVKYSWDNSGAVGVDFDFQNYVIVRNDVNSTVTADVQKITQISSQQLGFA